MKEIWKDIEGYEGRYQVSNLGRIKSLNYRGHGLVKILKTNINKKGYVYITLQKNNQQKEYTIHRLVAEAFIPNPNNYPIINHKDENPSNNKVDNLEWCTYKYNNTYGTRIEKTSRALKGKKMNKEIRNKISEKAKERFKNKENHPLYGKHHSEETKSKISRALENKYTGENSSVSRKVRCITTGEIFTTVTQASKKMKTHRSDINKCCRKIHKTAGKLPDGTRLEWEYID